MKINEFFFQCKSCGLTQETRNAFCASKSGKVYNETFCSNRQLPELSRSCNQTTGCNYQWYSSEWSNCSVECGNGVRTRNVVCGKLNEKGIEKAEKEDKCEVSSKPSISMICDSGKICGGQWFKGPWSDCSKKCGGGERLRKVICIADGKTISAKSCGEDTIAFSTEECNKEPCVEDELIPLDTTSKPIEEDDESEELCDEETEDDDLELVEIMTTDDDAVSTAHSTSDVDTSESSLNTEELILSDSTLSFEITEAMTTISDCK